MLHEIIEQDLEQELLMDSLASYDNGDVYRAICKRREAEFIEKRLFFIKREYSFIFDSDNCFEALQEMEEIEACIQEH